MDKYRFYQLITLADEGNKEAIEQLQLVWYIEEEVVHFLDKEWIENAKLSETKGPYTLYIMGLHEIFYKNVEAACNYYVSSMLEGCSDAFYMVSLLLDTGVLIDPTLNSKTLLEASIEMGNTNACIEYGERYCKGEEQLFMFKKALKLGNYHALYDIGLYYQDKNEIKKAVKYYEKSCEHDNHHALFNLAVIYQYGDCRNDRIYKSGRSKGNVVKRDVKFAKDLLKKSMELGNVRAITNLGNIYNEEGDYSEAKRYYKLAIQKNDAVACYNLGRMYKQEDKLPKAIKLFILGARIGSDSCRITLMNYGIIDLDKDLNDNEILKLCAFNESFKHFGAYDDY